MAKELDWEKLGTVEAMGEWLRTKSDALCVLVIRPHDSVFLVDPECKPMDAFERCAEYLPRLAQRVDHQRKTKNGIRAEMDQEPGARG